MSSAGDEIVDVIDEMGNIIALATRRDMRSMRLPHRCVYMLVFDSRGRLFIHQRTGSKDIYPYYWDLCVGGVLASGESFDDGARREGREELGVDLAPCPLFPFKYSDDRTVVQAMVYNARHDGPFVLQQEEISTGRFVDVQDLADLFSKVQFCPDSLQVWKTFDQHMNRSEK